MPVGWESSHLQHHRHRLDLELPIGFDLVALRFARGWFHMAQNSCETSPEQIPSATKSNSRFKRCR